MLLALIRVAIAAAIIVAAAEWAHDSLPSLSAILTLDHAHEAQETHERTSAHTHDGGRTWHRH